MSTRHSDVDDVSLLCNRYTINTFDYTLSLNHKFIFWVHEGPESVSNQCHSSNREQDTWKACTRYYITWWNHVSACNTVTWYIRFLCDAQPNTYLSIKYLGSPSLFTGLAWYDFYEGCDRILWARTYANILLYRAPKTSPEAPSNVKVGVKTSYYSSSRNKDKCARHYCVLSRWRVLEKVDCTSGNNKFQWATSPTSS